MGLRAWESPPVGTCMLPTRVNQYVLSIIIIFVSTYETLDNHINQIVSHIHFHQQYIVINAFLKFSLTCGQKVDYNLTEKTLVSHNSMWLQIKIIKNL